MHRNCFRECFAAAHVLQVKDPRLNEQHSGAMTGTNKRTLAELHGEEQVMKWRRTSAPLWGRIAVVSIVVRFRRVLSDI